MEGSTLYYDKNAQVLSSQYNGIKSSDIHYLWERHLPKQPGLACDIGAGSGRDANWLANNGWDVIAVEPSKAMRELAERNSHPNVTWLEDSLPDLDKLRALGHRFDLILLSAVWMHIPKTQRERVFRILTELLSPSALLVISLRYGHDKAENAERNFHKVTADELREYAKQRAIAVICQLDHKDLSRKHVTWETMVFKMPDDGTGSLPFTWPK